MGWRFRASTVTVLAWLVLLAFTLAGSLHSHGGSHVMTDSATGHAHPAVHLAPAWVTPGASSPDCSHADAAGGICCHHLGTCPAGLLAGPVPSGTAEPLAGPLATADTLRLGPSLAPLLPPPRRSGIT
jgi:hypothetical protein